MLRPVDNIYHYVEYFVEKLAINELPGDLLTVQKRATTFKVIC